MVNKDEYITLMTSLFRCWDTKPVAGPGFATRLTKTGQMEWTKNNQWLFSRFDCDIIFIVKPSEYSAPVLVSKICFDSKLHFFHLKFLQ